MLVGVALCLAAHPLASAGEIDPTATATAGGGGDLRIEFNIDHTPPATNEFAPAWFYGGEIEIDMDHEVNYDLDGSDDDDLGLIEPKVELNLSYRPSPMFEAFASLDLTRELAYLDEGENEDRQTRLNLLQAHVTVRDIIEGLSLRLGRQEFADEREWLYEEKLDALRLYYRHSNLGLEASVSRKNLVDRNLLGREGKAEANYWFLLGRYLPEEDIELQPFAFVIDDRGSGRERLVFLGLRSMGEPFDDFEYWFESAYLAGRGKRDSRTGRQEAISAFGLDVGGTYTFDLPFEPSVTLGYAFGSGDADPKADGDHNFRQTGLQDNEARFNGVSNFKYYGEVFDPELSNLHVLTAALGVRPTSGTSLDLVYHLYRQEEAADEIRDTDLDQDPNGTSRDLGQEVDLIAAWKALDNLKFTAVLGYFRPGDAFGDRADNAYLVSLEAVYRF